MRKMLIPQGMGVFLLFSHNFSVVSTENLKVLHLFLTVKDL